MAQGWALIVTVILALSGEANVCLQRCSLAEPLPNTVNGQRMGVCPLTRGNVRTVDDDVASTARDRELAQRSFTRPSFLSNFFA